MSTSRSDRQAASVAASTVWCALAGLGFLLLSGRSAKAQLPTREAASAAAAVAVATLTVQPASGPGGAPRTGTITLTGAAPAGTGTAVQLTLAGGTAAAVPATVTVPPGARSVSFPIATQPVAVRTSLSLSARTANDASVKAALTIDPPAIRSVSLAASRTVGGNAVSGVLQLDAPAPLNGLPISLAVSPASNAVIVRDVLVPAQATRVSFSVTTTPVSAPLDVVLSAIVRDAPAATGASVSLAVLPLEVATVTASALHVYGGDATEITVRLTGVTAQDMAVPLRLVQSAGSALPTPMTLPPTITIPAGRDQASLRWTTTTVAQPVEMQVVAGSATTAPSRDNSVRVGVHARPFVTGLSISPSPIVASQPVTVTVQLAWPPLPPLTTTPVLPVTLVTLGSSSPLVPAGPALPATFLQTQVRTTLPVGIIADVGSVTISARSGISEQSRTVSLVPAAIAASAIVLDKTTVLGGTTARGTVILSRPADAGGATIFLKTSADAVRVPATLVVAAGNRQVAFPVETQAVDRDQSVTIAAGTAGSATVEATVAVKRLAVASVKTDVSAVYGGDQVVQAAVALTGPTPAGGATVLLSSALTGVTTTDGLALPARIAVPAGRAGITVGLRIPAVREPASLGIGADVVPAGTGVTVAATTPVGGVTAPSVQVLPLPRGLTVRTLAPEVDIDHLTGRLRLDFTVANAGQIPASAASLLPVQRFVIESDHPDLVGPDTVAFAPGTSMYSVMLRSRVPVNDVPVRVRVRGPQQDESPFSNAATVVAPRLHTATVTPRQTAGGNTLTVVARLTRAAGPGGVAGRVVLEGQPATRFTWPAGSEEVRVAVPTRPTTINRSPISEVVTTTAETGGVTTRAPLSVELLGTAVIELLKNSDTNTLLPGESTTLTARLQNPAPTTGFPGVEFVRSREGVFVNGADRATVTAAGSSTISVRITPQELPPLPAVTREVFVRARAVHDSLRPPLELLLVVVPPPDLQAISVSNASLRGGAAVGVTVRITPYVRNGPPAPRRIPIRVESSHPALIAPFDVSLSIDQAAAGAMVTTGVVTSPTAVTLRATVAGKTVSTIVTLQP